MCIFNKDFSKILLLKRNKEKREKNKADWGHVGGRVEFGEKLIDACIREAREEIGVNLNPERLKLLDIKETPYLSDIFHAIHFVYTTTLDENQEIKLNFDCNNESDEFRWFSLENLPEKMLDTKEDVLEIANKARRILIE